MVTKNVIDYTMDCQIFDKSGKLMGNLEWFATCLSRLVLYLTRVWTSPRTNHIANHQSLEELVQLEGKIISVWDYIPILPNLSWFMG